MEKQYPSRLLEKAVSEFSRLPGIGRKTSLRLVLHMLRQTNEDVDGFVSAISHLKKEVKYCKVCHNIIKKITVDGRGTYYCSKCQH